MEQTTVYQTSQPPVPQTANSPQQSPKLPIKKSPFPKLFLLLFVGVVGSLLIGGGWYLLQANQTELNNSEPDKTGVQTETVDATPEAIDSQLATPTPISTHNNIAFDFYDSSVWLNPHLDWRKVSAGEISLADEAIFIQGPQIPFTALPLQGTEWVAEYNPNDETLVFKEDSTQSLQRLTLLAWEDSLSYQDYFFSPVKIQTKQQVAQGYIRSQGGKLQTLIHSQTQQVATDSAQVELITKRVFLSDPVNIIDLILKYRR